MRGAAIGLRALVLAAGAAALFLFWMLIPSEEEGARDAILRRAGRDLVEACNEAAAATGHPERFTPEDVTREPREPPGGAGVAPLVSVLEARRDGFACRWNGVDAPAISRAGQG